MIETSTGGATSTPTATATAGPSPTPTRTPTPVGTNTPTSAPTVTPTTQPVFQNASFVYDGDGKRVKSIINSAITTYFVGAHFEVTGSTVTKYYYAGSQRIAMRSGTWNFSNPVTGTLSYLLGDHLGSTSLTTDAAGNKVSEVRYTAWGEVRYASGNVHTKYQYTGQFSYEQEFGLYFYNARWYDSSLGRFAQADTIVPPGVQGYDRYAYVNNNPGRYTDPTGHMRVDNEGGVGDGGCGLECFKTLRAKEKSKWAAKQMRERLNSCNTFAACNGGFTGEFDSFLSLAPSTLTTVYIGGVNPASAPGYQDDDSVPRITNLRGSGAFGIPIVLDMINNLLPRSPSTDTDVLLSYVTTGDGSIDDMIVTLDNRGGKSAVDLRGVIITTNESVYLQPNPIVSVSPGQTDHTVICSNCIADNTLLYNMSAHGSANVTITVRVGAVYDFGMTGTNYGVLPISYTIPRR